MSEQLARNLGPFTTIDRRVPPIIRGRSSILQKKWKGSKYRVATSAPSQITNHPKVIDKARDKMSNKYKIPIYLHRILNHNALANERAYQNALLLWGWAQPHAIESWLPRSVSVSSIVSALVVLSLWSNYGLLGCRQAPPTYTPLSIGRSIQHRVCRWCPVQSTCQSSWWLDVGHGMEVVKDASRCRRVPIRECRLTRLWSVVTGGYSF